ncbi:hypothetical protein J3F84DRAFT_155879 [Trichoderma pleuroticola]
MARSAQWHTSPGRHVNRISCMQLGYAAALPTETPVFGYQFAPGGLETWPSTRADSGTDRVSNNSLGTGHGRRWARVSVLPMSHRVPGTCGLPSILLGALHSTLAALRRRRRHPLQLLNPLSRKKGAPMNKTAERKGEGWRRLCCWALGAVLLLWTRQQLVKGRRCATSQFQRCDMAPS